MNGRIASIDSRGLPLNLNKTISFRSKLQFNLISLLLNQLHCIFSSEVHINHLHLLSRMANLLLQSRANTCKSQNLILFFNFYKFYLKVAGLFLVQLQQSIWKRLNQLLFPTSICRPSVCGTAAVPWTQTGPLFLVYANTVSKTGESV